MLFLLVLSQSGYGLCVSSYQAKLRTEPSAKARVSWVVGRYMPLLEVERRGRWWKVKDQDGEQHWVASGDVTNRVRCVTVRSRRATLRSGPGTRFSPVALRTADKYSAFKRLETTTDESDWFWVEDENGSRAWVHGESLWRPMKVSEIGF